MADITRLYFAIVLGASATAALLAALGLAEAAGRASLRRGVRAAVGVAWVALLVAWLVGAVLVASRHGVVAWHGGAVFAAAVLLALVGPQAKAVQAVSVASIVMFSLVRGAGAVRFFAMSSGWLPPRYALVAGVADVLFALSAPMAAVMFARGTPPGPSVVRAWSAASLASLGVGWALLARDVRPMPAFEGLYSVFLAPLVAASVAVAWWRARARGRVETSVPSA